MLHGVSKGWACSMQVPPSRHDLILLLFFFVLQVEVTRSCFGLASPVS